MEENKKNSFDTLNAINLGDKIKEKIGYKYLSWADAWSILKTNYPEASSTIYTRKIVTTEETVSDEGGFKKTIKTTYENDVPYFTDGRTCYVKVGVTVDGVELVETYPVMDMKNNAVALAAVTMTAVNKALQRAFVKACARHGLGLYVYAGEDLPDADKKSIDFDGIYAQAVNGSYNGISENEFKDMQTVIINRIQTNTFDESTSTSVMEAIGKILGGKRLSQLDYATDSMLIQKINTYFKLIDIALATPAVANGR